MARGGRRFKRGRGRRAPARPAEATPTQESATPGPASVSSSPSPPAYHSPATNNQPRSGAAPTVRDVSAGGVVYRRADDNSPVEVVLVGRLRPKRWALPKGTPVLGETLEGTAVREVGEETGLLVRIERPLDQIHYWFVWGGVRHSKTVHFYLMQMVGGDTANHDGEYDVVEWFPIGEALRRLSYPNEARIVDKAQQVLGA
ncbi:MAG: NUDIX hydrolase [Chloroflexi bacterium]|nr:NUDIX hydrolase [Chloroflexota bacterium]MBV9894330.1 NUDIX hydrolase [Chloroflexota bacterium]